MQNVRVVQRNLVYVVGLALELCYEDLLKGPEYFGQFGKVVKARCAANLLLISRRILTIFCLPRMVRS